MVNAVMSISSSAHSRLCSLCFDSLDVRLRCRHLTLSVSVVSLRIYGSRVCVWTGLTKGGS